MKLNLTLAAAFSAAVVFAGPRGERESVWPEGKMPHFQTGQVAAMTDEAAEPGFRREEHRTAYVEWLTPPAGTNRNGACMVLVSGGGYGCCCDCGLVDMWNRLYTAEGYQCVNFVYRTPRPAGLAYYQSAWEDGQRAIRFIRAQAKKRGFDPERIGTMSMSAGSHLATLLATSALTPAYEKVDALDDVPCHLNWAITGAIAYGMTDGLGEPNVRQGDAPDVKLDPLFKFDAKTAPMCMFHGGRDCYSPFASTHVFRKLRAMKVPSELHLFADRTHGFWGDCTKGDDGTAYDHWFEDATGFLRQINADGRLGAEVELMSRFPNDDARASVEKLAVWPEGKTPDFQKHQFAPYLEWHAPKVLKTKAIQIIYSGGCYTGNTPDGFEVAPARRFLNEKGMTVVTLKYRTTRPFNLAKHVSAWQDLQRSVRVVRAEAAKRGLDPNRIGIMGSSAGGHLTLMGATSSRHAAYNAIDEIDRLPCKVQWAVAIYPAYALTDGLEVPNTTGGIADDARLAPEFSFDPDTCPMVFIHGEADGWAAMNSVKAWEQLRRMDVQSDLHTLAGRNHCFQAKAAPGTGSYTWLNRIWEFMNHKGFNK